MFLDTESQKHRSFFTLSNLPYISLVIPCYNVPEEQISRALSSVQHQTFQNYETIIIDDGSQEKYSEVLQRLCADLDNTTLIQTENRGVSAARNTGVSVAQGKYIAFLDADDVLADDFFERAWLASVATNADFVIGGLSIITEPDKFRTSPRSDLPQYEVYEPADFIRLQEHLMGENHLIRFQDGHIGRGPVSRLIRSEIAKKCSFDEELSIGEDIVWNFQLLNYCERICLVRENWYGYLQHSVSVSHRFDPGIIYACENFLNRLASMADLQDDCIFAAYVDEVCERLRQCWNTYLNIERQRNRKSYQDAKQRIVSSQVWGVLGTVRCFRSIGSRRKIVSLLYRLNLFFFAKEITCLLSKNHLLETHDSRRTLRSENKYDT